MRADPELAERTYARLLMFATERGAKPLTVFRAALGYSNPTVLRWTRGEPARIRPRTLAALNAWMDDSAGWRPGTPGRQAARRD